MKRILLSVFLIWIISAQLLAQNQYKEISKDDSELLPISKPSSIIDRAGGTHNVSNIGLFFENRGKLYPRRITQGPSGEFPINSGRHYIYRINPIVAIPGNTIQCRFTDFEEWEARAGFHNRDLALIAFSDNPSTWHPSLGWPVKNNDGENIFISDQDSYCVYNDSSNTVEMLGIEVAQTGYAYGVKFAKNLLFFTFELTNHGDQDLRDLYFAYYMDMDIGNISGGVPEYGDDKLDFIPEKNFVYFYDADGYSSEWGGATGYIGCALLKTPEVNDVMLGLTDMHYNEYYDDEIKRDSIEYGIISSSEDLYNSNIGNKFFHLGSSTNLHFDDPNTIPAGGLDLVATMSSGPYTLNRGESLTFYTVIVAGSDLTELLESLEVAYRTLNANFELPKPPTTPNLIAYPGDNRVTLYWNDEAEKSLDKFSQEFDFEGYRLYRSLDKGLHWDQIDRNLFPATGPDPVPLFEVDLINDIGADKGLQYSYTDSSVKNGFEYWYTITAFDRGDSLVESLESPIGNTIGAPNTVSVIPVSSALGRTPVLSDSFNQISGNSNYRLSVEPVDDENLAGNDYRISFLYRQKTERGRLKTESTITFTDSSSTKPYRYGFQFTAPNRLNLLNLTTGETIREGYGYVSGATYNLPGMRVRLTDPDPNAPPEFLPQNGDFITINYAVTAVKNESDTVLNSRPIAINQLQATDDGILFRLLPPDIIKSVSRIGGTDNVEMTFSVVDTTLILDNLYLLSVEGNGMVTAEQGFVSLLIRDSDLLTIDSLDTLYSGDSFIFDGIEGKIVFPDNSPPGPGNIFSIETQMPKLPNILDVYEFSIQPSSINQTFITQNMSRIRVVPNPYVVASLFEPEFGELRKEPLRQLQFINLPSECTIYIFTVAGDLIKTISHQSNIGTAYWDLRAEGGREITTGIYIYVVKSKESEHLSRFAVIK
jgi:hypothetical protein